MRVAIRRVRGRPTTSRISRTRVVASLPTRDAVHPERLADRATDRVARVERGERVLEHHLHPPPQRPQLRLAQVRDVGALEQDAAAGRLVQPEHRASDGRLSAPRLADEPDGLAALDRERDAVDRLDVADVAVEEHAALDREPDAEVVQLDERRLPFSLTPPRPRRCVRLPLVGRGRVEARGALAGVEPLELREAPPCSGRDGIGSVARTGHESGSLSMLRGAPGIGRSGCRRPRSSRGTLCRSPSVYGWRGEAKSSSAVPVSTSVPAYITCTRSHVPATTPRSCVMRTSAVSRSLTSSRRRSRICAWIVTSSAVVGSSAIRSFGSQASAIAIITRCRMPPENWCG